MSKFLWISLALSAAGLFVSPVAEDGAGAPDPKPQLATGTTVLVTGETSGGGPLVYDDPGILQVTVELGELLKENYPHDELVDRALQRLDEGHDAVERDQGYLSYCWAWDTKKMSWAKVCVRQTELRILDIDREDLILVEIRTVVLLD